MSKISILAVLVFGVALLVTGEWWAGLIIGFVVTALILTLMAGIVFVPARKAAVVLNRLEGYSGLRRAGLAFIFPFWEHIGFYLDLSPKTARFSVSDIHTRDPVPVSISLMLFYHLAPWTIQSELRPQLIDGLEFSAPTIIQNQVEHLLHELVGYQAVTTLLQPETRAHLEACLTRELAGRVGWLGIVISDRVMLCHIALPESLQAEINRAQQTRIHARARADALNVLRERIGTQPDHLWDKVLEVEAIDTMARHGAPVFFSNLAGWNGFAS
jgi:regulator of protease activity HflC (stomatin/prohibitin superfamily)